MFKWKYYSIGIGKFNVNKIFKLKHYEYNYEHKCKHMHINTQAHTLTHEKLHNA